ncbi:MAG: DUF2155 domain-containing protein [Parvularculaceae bacterium]
MRCVPIAAALLLAAMPAGAQEEDAGAGPSELDILSQSADDPFQTIVESQKREPVSVTLRALNKITARYTDIEVKMNEIARFGSLELLPRTCDKRPPEEFPETTAFLEIFDTEIEHRESDLKIQPPEALTDPIDVAEIDGLPGQAVGDVVTPGEERIQPEVEGPKAEGVNIFKGWMFASSPALNALEHPVYDVWVIDCKTRAASN